MRRFSEKTTSSARFLRHNATDVEQKLWARLRNNQLGHRFRRQHAFPPYIVDFYCPNAGLVIELDGGQHTPEKDADRTAFLEQRSLVILRFWNHDVNENIDGVLDIILRTMNIRYLELAPSPGASRPPLPVRGEGKTR